MAKSRPTVHDKSQMSVELSGKRVPTYTTTNGNPVKDPLASQRIGKHGPLLLQDFALIDLLAHFDRERIPERVVHAKGSGAYGEFEVTDDITDLNCADFLSKIGKKTKTFTRFSTVGGEKGSADAARDPRGFATKFYTDEGNIDWVYNNTPVFFIRDPSKFPVFIHTQKRNPETNLKDATMMWDYIANNQECCHQIMVLFSDRGTPANYRQMNGYSGHTYKWIKKDGSFNYVQIHMKTDQGIKNLTNDEAVALSGTNPDHAQEDLFNSIKSGSFPSWTCYVQVCTPEQAEKLKWSVFDLTKVWPHDQFPLRRFGKLTLNKNVQNYFAETEQAAFSPSNTVPGWETSADPVLQSRLFSYPDTQRHRLGTNFAQIPVNCPYHAHTPYHRDGQMAVNGNSGSLPNYPSSFEPLQYRQDINLHEKHEKWVGEAVAYQWVVGTDGVDFQQPAELWKVLGKTPDQQEHLVYNIAVSLSGARPEVQDKTFGMFDKVDAHFDATLQRSPRSKL
ncbi:catalase-like domain-containing protein [Yarrowia lipolytica]|uniref:Catalase n=1 Tax=Yarrowia lipolytica TaxID=4952 RepID=A0A371CF48_YARLL|nr:catalase-like domain-containing protein [Yarrowia lipolytica]KAE8172290.1 catalase-like domain-containing protein [Yarrowia lipolytica]RDW28889.1 catalase-like domain-containing protein [Yarrowia lipolytica]RDW34099.1 catalase-like domain-containing protein [Yarrowia lipolytica]RDW40941.1 catalase-like domain-containing protein [Yarrowia lipolytica]